RSCLCLLRGCDGYVVVVSVSSTHCLFSERIFFPVLPSSIQVNCLVKGMLDVPVAQQVAVTDSSFRRTPNGMRSTWLLFRLGPIRIQPCNIESHKLNLKGSYLSVSELKYRRETHQYLQLAPPDIRHFVSDLFPSCSSRISVETLGLLIVSPFFPQCLESRADPQPEFCLFRSVFRHNRPGTMDYSQHLKSHGRICSA